MRFFAVLILLGIGNCQELRRASDFPLVQPTLPRTELSAPSATCGPKWLGGCYDPKTQLTWSETFTDKKWWIPTLIFFGGTTYDYVLSVRGTDRRWADGTPVCVEGNHDLPLRPGAGDVAKDFAKTHLPVLVIGTVIHKVTGRSKWASWIYPGMMAYGTQLHIRSANGWWACQ